MICSAKAAWSLASAPVSNPHDNEQAGLPLHPPGVRYERLAETLGILDACFNNDEVNFEGKYFQLTNFVSYPRPVQRPVPLMLERGGRACCGWRRGVPT